MKNKQEEAETLARTITFILKYYPKDSATYMVAKSFDNYMVTFLENNITARS